MHSFKQKERCEFDFRTKKVRILIYNKKMKKKMKYLLKAAMSGFQTFSGAAWTEETFSC